MFVKEPYAGYYSYDGLGQTREPSPTGSTLVSSNQSESLARQLTYGTTSREPTSVSTVVPSAQSNALATALSLQQAPTQTRPAPLPGAIQIVGTTPIAKTLSTAMPSGLTQTLQTLPFAQGGSAGVSSVPGAAPGMLPPPLPGMPSAGTIASTPTTAVTTTATTTPASTTTLSKIAPIAAGLGIGLLALRFLR